jgi:nucleotide-binding universal stress UspA family protein
MNKIIVGLDESPASAAALRWAADYARLTGSSVHAIHAAELPYRPIIGGPNGVFALNNEFRLSDDYRHRIHQVWDEARPEPSWRLEIYLGEPGPILTEQSIDADLLVVGTHFHVGLGRVFPGSVSHYCLTHSQVPVIAVPAKALSSHTKSGEGAGQAAATANKEPEPSAPLR